MPVSFRKPNDLLHVTRGAMVVLALWQHFSEYLHYWYIAFFSVNDIHNDMHENSVVELYKYHFDYLGKTVPLDWLVKSFAAVFILWVTHAFVAFIGYNFARNTVEDLRANFKKMFSKYLILFLLFYGENMIVSTNFGMGISLYGVTCWMLILMIGLILFRFFSTRTVTVLYGVLFATKVLGNSGLFHIPDAAFFLEKIHPWAYLSEDPYWYLLTFLGGVFLGKALLYNAAFEKKTNQWIALSAICTISSFVLVHQQFNLDQVDIFKNGTTFMNQNAGMFFILSICTLLILLIHKFRAVDVPKVLTPLKYIGIHSIGIFLVHRILFLKILAPIRFHLGSYAGLPMTDFSLEHLLIYIPITVLVYRMLIKSGFFGSLIVKVPNKN